MRLATLEIAAQARPGVMVGDDILDLRAAAASIPEAAAIAEFVRAILAGGEVALGVLRMVHGLASSDRLARELKASGALMPAAQANLLAPIPDPGLILSCGANYRRHMEEMGARPPSEPIAFLKSVNSIIGDNAPIVLPKAHPDMVDWEAEFAAVIGKPCHAVTAAEALGHVAGYTMINDVSARNWVPRMQELSGIAAAMAWDRNLLGKQFPSFCPMGPSLALKDEIADPTAVSFQLKVNGATKQEACTEDLLFTLADLIAHYSQFYRFMPGDVVTTGSPAGVGMARQPPEFLRPGDVVEISAQGIGALRNPVIAER